MGAQYEHGENVKIGDKAKDAKLKLHKVKRYNRLNNLRTIISEEGTTKRDTRKWSIRTLNSRLWLTVGSSQRKPRRK